MMNNTDSLICDWFAASQVHHDGCPELSEGIVNCCDKYGQLEWQTHRGYNHPGSYDTNIRVKSDGNRVSLSGNIGRFCRADNVFGYGVDDCKKLANSLLDKLGLPPFTDGHEARFAIKNNEGEFVNNIAKGGAKISQIHLTKNFFCGSDRNAKDFLYWLTTQKLAHTATSNYKNDSVYFGEDSTYQRTKVYNKSKAIKNELNKINRKVHDNNWRPLQLEYVKQLYKWATDSGLVRIETELKSRYLTQKYLNDWSACTDASMLVHYENKGGAIMKRCSDYVDLADLPARAQDVYHAYMSGENLKDRHGWSNRTYRRYRKMLLPVGVDIYEKLNVTALKVRPRIIELTPATMPDFYQLPSVAELKKAA